MLGFALCMQETRRQGASPSPRSLACSTRQMYLKTTTRVRVQNTSDMAPSTCPGVGSALKTLGNTYSGEVPACQAHCVMLKLSVGVCIAAGVMQGCGSRRTQPAVDDANGLVDQQPEPPPLGILRTATLEDEATHPFLLWGWLRV